MFNSNDLAAKKPVLDGRGTGAVTDSGRTVLSHSLSVPEGPSVERGGVASRPTDPISPVPMQVEQKGASRNLLNKSTRCLCVEGVVSFEEGGGKPLFCPMRSLRPGGPQARVKGHRDEGNESTQSQHWQSLCLFRGIVVTLNA